MTPVYLHSRSQILSTRIQGGGSKSIQDPQNLVKYSNLDEVVTTEPPTEPLTKPPVEPRACELGVIEHTGQWVIEDVWTYQVLATTPTNVGSDWAVILQFGINVAGK